VADALHRQPAEVTKFFGCDLGAQTSYRDDNEKSIVNGNHSAQALQQLLTRYIQTFVLCGTCWLPETSK
jgi:translation initiation factor 5